MKQNMKHTRTISRAKQAVCTSVKEASSNTALGDKPQRNERAAWDARRPKARRARVMEIRHLDVAVSHVRQGNNPEADELKLLLSFYAGLRVCEIAALTLSAVTDAKGDIADHIWLSRHVTKNGHERTIPMHASIRSALERFRRRHPDIDFFAFSARYGVVRRQCPNTLGVWFGQVYRKAGLIGCSSHSGRRSFVTHLARSAGRSMCSLHDVQRLVGHARLDTTQSYIEPSPNVATMINAIGHETSNDLNTPSTETN